MEELAYKVENEFDLEVEVKGNKLIINTEEWIFGDYEDKLDYINELATDVVDVLRKHIFDVDVKFGYDEVIFSLLF